MDSLGLAVVFLLFGIVSFAVSIVSFYVRRKGKMQMYLACRGWELYDSHVFVSSEFWSCKGRVMNLAEAYRFQKTQERIENARFMPESKQKPEMPNIYE